MVVQTVPKLRDEGKPFIRREADYFVMRELHLLNLPKPPGGDKRYVAALPP